MDLDDEVMVVIVGDEGCSGENYEMPTPKIKEEQFDESDIMELLEKAEKYGKPVVVSDSTNDYKKSEFGIGEYEEQGCLPDIFSIVKLEQFDDQDEDYIPEYEDYNPENEDYNYNPEDKDYNPEDEDYNPEDEDYNPEDEDYNPENEDCDPEDEIYIPQEEEYLESSGEEDTGRIRRAMLRPLERKSFINDLKQKYPELQKDMKKLVRTLAEIMSNVKKPPPPKDYFIMNDILFECRKCGAMSESMAAAERHYQEKHGPRYLVCYACGVDFRSATNLYKHEKRCVAPDAITLLKARALFLGRKARSRPFIPDPKDFLLRTPVVKKFGCSQCSAVFFTQANLEAHENLHRGERPYRCHICPCAYTSQRGLMRHMKKHSDEEYICHHCSRSFKMKSALSAHLNTHLPVPKFGCQHCERRFASKQALGHHVRRVHLQLPHPCVCKMCHKSYSRMTMLRDHMKKTHGMSLMTRRMFFKALPKLTDSQLKQPKKIVVNSIEYGQTVEP